MFIYSFDAVKYLIVTKKELIKIYYYINLRHGFYSFAKNKQINCRK